MKIMPLSEGSFTIDHTKIFLPFNPLTDDLQQRARGSLLVEIQPFLVDTGKDLILLDAGLGFSRHGVLQIYENIHLHGYVPEDVTKVLMSHLHRDHAGGLTFKNIYSHEFHFAFPGALHYINRNELDFAINGESASYDAEALKILQNHEQVILTDHNGIIDGYISYELTAGHSRYHQVFFIRDGAKILFFGGDEAPQLQQMKTRFVAKYDQDGKKAMALRQEWWKKGQEEKWTFTFYHDINTPTYSFD